MKPTLRTFLFLVFIFSSTFVFSQLDSEHYLPPLKQVSNNAAIKQQAVYLSTPESTAFDVEVYQGTNNTPIATITGLAKGASKIYNLADGDNNVTLVTNVNTGVVLTNSGLRFVSPSGKKFYVNYRGRSSAQAGSLTSKGGQALGRDFRWGGIPNRANNGNLTTSLGIMASEDNTTVNVFGYDPDCEFRIGNDRGGNTADSFTINLNKGETYVIEAAKNQTTANINGWLGASVTSNKKIAISLGGLNVGVRTTSGSRDVGIDQPVPTNVLGREYVFVRGNGQNETEFPIIVGTKNGTDIFAGGTYLATINDGDYYEIPGSYYSSTNAGAAMFVTTSKDAYAYQCLQGATGTKIQTIGMNFIAPVNCLLPDKLDEVPQIDKIAGATSNVSAITIIASAITPNANIVVRENGVPVALPTPVNVVGTSDWKTFYVDNLSGEIDVQSTGPIAVGTFMSLGSNAGLAGYFSGFDSVPVVEIEITGGGCFPSSDLKETTGNFDAYQWYHDGSPIAGATSDTHTPTALGDYYVVVTKGTCSYPSSVASVYNCDPDIVVKKTADISSVDEGSNVTFTITVESSGINPVTNLVIEDVIPAEFDLVSATPNTGTWNNPNWTIGTMNAGQIHNIVIVAKAKLSAPAGTVTNTVSNTQDQIDSNLTPDDLTEDVTIQKAGIGISKTGMLDEGGDGLQVGDKINYTFTVTNTGQTILENIVVNDPKLGGAVSGPFSGDNNGNGTLDVSEVWIYKGEYTITNADLVAGEVINTATVDSNLTNGTVKSGTSNTLTTDLNVADLSLDKSVDNLSPELGEQLTYTITITNSSNDDATGVSVEDNLPVGYSYVTNTATEGGVFTSNKLTWTNKTISAGSTVTYVYKVIVNTPSVLPNYPADEYENIAQITASDLVDPDSTPNNNIGGEDDQDKVILSVNADTDKDGIADNVDLDNDNDGILDTDEGRCFANLANNNAEVPSVYDTSVSHVQSFDSGAIKIYDASLVDNWNTTASDNRIEIWHNNNTASSPHVNAYEGNQFIELNANVIGAVYQDIATQPGSTINWQVAHRGRSGVDTADMKVGAPGGTLTTIETMSTGNTAWVLYSGTYTVPAGQTTTRFQFNAVSTASGNNSIGNFIDTFKAECTSSTDTDNDGIPDYLDVDSDNDGCYDAIEGGANFTSNDLTSSNNLADENEGSVNA